MKKELEKYIIDEIQTICEQWTKQMLMKKIEEYTIGTSKNQETIFKLSQVKLKNENYEKQCYAL